MRGDPVHNRSGVQFLSSIDLFPSKDHLLVYLLEFDRTNAFILFGLLDHSQNICATVASFCAKIAKKNLKCSKWNRVDWHCLKL